MQRLQHLAHQDSRDFGMRMLPVAEPVDSIALRVDAVLYRAFRKIPSSKLGPCLQTQPTEDLGPSHGTMVQALLIWLLWVALLVLRHTFQPSKHRVPGKAARRRCSHEPHRLLRGRMTDL
jgi:hypothetical protein